MDQSKKTMRHFYCRDVLWETFEQMANDFDCSIDYLVNEAMRYYARSKNYQSPGAPANGPGATVPPPMGNAPSGGNGAPSNHFGGGNGPAAAAKPMRPNAPTSQPPMMPANGASPMASQRRPAPPTPGYAARANPNNTAGPTSHMPSSLPHAAPSPMPPPSSSPPPMSGGTAGPTLFLIYNGQRYPVTKDQFIIGRGSKTSDLPIKDGNISRKHAAVIRRNGTFYIKDLGSTNGIDYKGMRIDNKRIDEGDVFHLCDYELRFTYRADG
jgi:FHA domain